jgi:hypothetical protein
LSERIFRLNCGLRLGIALNTPESQFQWFQPFHEESMFHMFQPFNGIAQDLACSKRLTATLWFQPFQ